MSKMSREPLGEDLHVGTADVDPGSVLEVRRLPDGRAVMLPRSPTRRQLNGDALEVLADVQATVREVERLRTELDELVQEARELGAPWTLIGFSVGMTSDAARKRWLDAEG